MSPSRWSDLDRIFTEASRLPASDRTAFVTGACGADHELRREALSLLSSSNVPETVLDRPAFEYLARAIAADGWGLSPGDRIGAYTLRQLLGTGGAGAVWRAHDGRLDRDVAIKFLLPHWSSLDRLHQFVDEARLAGSINHPNIVTVHDVGDHAQVPFIVSEFFQGQTLRERMTAVRLAVPASVSIVLDIARGLSAAHARGIVHRDLKPENVFIRADGGVKILDFGLATLQSASRAAEGTGALPTGIVGTAAYMAPEQVRGEEVDARADLFALGVIAYEMLAGRQPFRRSNTVETLDAVLNAEPPDLAAVPDIPAWLARVVMRLVQKPRDSRFQSAADLVWALEHSGLAAAPGAAAAPRRAWWRSVSLLAFAGVAVAALAVFGPGRARPASPTPLLQFTVPLPAGVALASAPAVSPDGRLIAFAGDDAAGRRLYVRALASRESTPVPGSDDGTLPFWSADSASLGFFARGHLMKVAWPGGAPVMVAAAPAPRGGTWNRDGIIVFAPDVILAGLSRVASAGGSGPDAVTILDVSAGDTSHSWPTFLADGVHFLYHVRSTVDGRMGVHLGRTGGRPLPTGQPLLRSDSEAAFAPRAGSRDGVLVYVLDGRIEARHFDLSRLSVGTDARSLGVSAASGTLYQASLLGVSSDVLAFADRPLPGGDLMEAVDRQGRRLRLWPTTEAQNWPRLSPDSRHLARQIVDARRNNPDLWVEDLERGSRVRITTDPQPDIQPVWSPDGRHLAYVTGNLPGRAGGRSLHIAAADGTGVLRTLSCPATYCEPTDWSPDGRSLVVTVHGEGGVDVWLVPAQPSGSPRPLLASAAVERDARLSPDGRWLAYVSNETGRPEVSVRSLDGKARFVLSSSGGDQPVWRRDGAELFFVEPGGYVQSVDVRWPRDGAPRFGVPVRLAIPRVGYGHWGTQYDVSRDGQRFIYLRPDDTAAPREIHVVSGWQALLD